jgi:hypothetical protein
VHGCSAISCQVAPCTAVSRGQEFACAGNYTSFALCRSHFGSRHPTSARLSHQAAACPVSLCSARRRSIWFMRHWSTFTWQHHRRPENWTRCCPGSAHAGSGITFRTQAYLQTMLWRQFILYACQFAREFTQFRCVCNHLSSLKALAAGRQPRHVVWDRGQCCCGWHAPGHDHTGHAVQRDGRQSVKSCCFVGHCCAIAHFETVSSVSLRPHRFVRDGPCPCSRMYSCTSSGSQAQNHRRNTCPFKTSLSCKRTGVRPCLCISRVAAASSSRQGSIWA